MKIYKTVDTVRDLPKTYNDSLYNDFMEMIVAREGHCSNDTWHEFLVTDENEYGYTDEEYLARYKRFSDWLISEGAEKGETILVYHWW